MDKAVDSPAGSKNVDDFKKLLQDLLLCSCSIISFLTAIPGFVIDPLGSISDTDYWRQFLLPVTCKNQV
ncbi:MAG: hypothetical protein JWQ09_2357 [Segetibacter sp.]|nr:hypothetical protein [Segetibacter sp.]